MDDETAAGQDLVLAVERQGNATTLRMRGELDAFTAPDLVDVCRSVYASGAREVVIDLTDTSFLDSSGLRALVGLQQLFGRDGGAVRLSQPSKPVMRVLEITGLTGYFSIDDARPT